ncbi:NAD-dependent epimerase/dehydratase family protein [Novispirillum itersonii]|uniref:Uronate dehydrogenase n=1 Tax=Novispirillum itersonii TaxID=189 RepID=A0A7W9ZJE4_NOVIT|nr:NAD(P)-dependent oxidoreductase [Novispirillum itersonii]MBB6211334.1 uronate dehydrogenase [Novispirillum itersonii]
MQRLLMTGAGGIVGSMLRPHLRSVAPIVRLSDLKDPGPAEAGEEIMPADLADAAAVDRAVEGCDGIIHLGGMSLENSFEVILDANIRGTYHLYDAARRFGVKRVLFASSNHVIGFHERETLLDADSPPRPDSLYGVSKGYGELLARYYYDKFGIETAIVRIGSCFPEPRNRRMLATWLSVEDMAALVERVFTVDRLGCPIIYGASANRESWWDNRKTGYLGWVPQDNADRFRHLPHLSTPETDPEDPAVRYQGGAFVPAGMPDRRR